MMLPLAPHETPLLCRAPAKCIGRSWFLLPSNGCIEMVARTKMEKMKLFPNKGVYVTGDFNCPLRTIDTCSFYNE